MTKLTFALMMFAACGDNRTESTNDAPLPPPTSRAVAVSGTFTPGEPGVMAALDVTTLTVAQQVAPVGAIAEDPVLRQFGDEYFVVNRNAGNNVTILDRQFRLVEQVGTGAGSNPQDVAVVGNRLYVPAFATAGVVVIARGSAVSTTIDLSALDPDGQPNCISALAIDSDVYVVCELLDENFVARGPGKVVVIDSATDRVRTTLTLTNANPFGMFERMPQQLGGDLVIPTVPDFTDTTQGCVERIAVGAAPSAAGCMVTNQQLGGFAASVDFPLDTTPVMWLVASGFAPMPYGTLRGFDLVANQLQPATTPATQLIGDVATCRDGTVVVTDQTMAANGLRVYDVASGERTTAPLSIGLKPASSRGIVCVDQ